jgi:hypothetical protein
MLSLQAMWVRKALFRNMCGQPTVAIGRLLRINRPFGFKLSLGFWAAFRAPFGLECLGIFAAQDRSRPKASDMTPERKRRT